MRVTKEKVRQKLKQVMDPELGVNIVDLGLIYKVRVKSEKGKTGIYILMTLTSPGCPLAGMIVELINEAVGDMGEVEVEITFDPPWTPEMVAEELRVKLGFG